MVVHLQLTFFVILSALEECVFIYFIRPVISLSHHVFFSLGDRHVGCKNCFKMMVRFHSSVFLALDLCSSGKVAIAVQRTGFETRNRGYVTDILPQIQLK